MKIAQICPFFYPVKGGMETHVMKISKEMVKKGHEVHVLTANTDREGSPLPKKTSKEGIKIFRFPVKFSFGDFGKYWPSFVRKIKEGYDIVHVHNYRHPHTIFALKKCNKLGIPCILTTHSPFHPKSSRSVFGRIFVEIYDNIISKIYDNKFSKIITINNSEHMYFEHVDKEKLVTVPNGINKNAFEKPNKKTKKRVKNKYNPKNKKLLVDIARVHPTKGIDFILKALNKSNSDYKFILIGPIQDKKYYKRLLKYKKRNNLDVTFAGFIPKEEKRSLLDLADLFVLPSIYEPFGIVILEAFAMGKSVIARDSDGPRYLIKNGKNGFLFKDNDFNSFLKYIKTLMENKKLYKKISKNNKKKAKKFLWSNITDKILNLYEEIS